MATEQQEFTYRMVVVTTPDGKNIWENHENHEELEDWAAIVVAVSPEFPPAFPYELLLEVVWESEECANKTSRQWGTKRENGHTGSGFLNRTQWMRCRKRQRVLEGTKRFGNDPINFIKKVCQRLAPDILQKSLDYGNPRGTRVQHPRGGLFQWQAREVSSRRDPSEEQGGAEAPQMAQEAGRASNQARSPEATARPTFSQRVRRIRAAQALLQEPVVSSGSTGEPRMEAAQDASPEGRGDNRTAPKRGWVGTPESWEPEECKCPICANTGSTSGPTRMDDLD